MAVGYPGWSADRRKGRANRPPGRKPTVTPGVPGVLSTVLRRWCRSFILGRAFDAVQ